MCLTKRRFFTRPYLLIACTRELISSVNKTKAAFINRKILRNRPGDKQQKREIQGKVLNLAVRTEIHGTFSHHNCSTHFHTFSRNLKQSFSSQHFPHRRQVLSFIHFTSTSEAGNHCHLKRSSTAETAERIKTKTKTKTRPDLAECVLGGEVGETPHEEGAIRVAHGFGIAKRVIWVSGNAANQTGQEPETKQRKRVIWVVVGVYRGRRRNRGGPGRRRCRGGGRRCRRCFRPGSGGTTRRRTPSSACCCSCSSLSSPRTQSRGRGRGSKNEYFWENYTDAHSTLAQRTMYSPYILT